jgi:cytochrome c oxidase subunit 1
MTEVSDIPAPAPFEEYPRGWRRFVYATNHRDVGLLYLWFAIFAGLVGGALSMAIRAELMQPGLQIFKDAHMFHVLVTGHGLIMIFFMIMPALIGGFGNWLVPLMIGSPDMAFPRLNGLAFWLLPFAFGLLILSMYVGGDGARVGFAGIWTLAASGSTSPSSGPAVDLIIFALHVAAVSTVLSAINFITTILNMRAPGMTLQKLPLFVWSMLVTAFLLLLAMPVLAAAISMLLADRHLGTTFFNPAGGGDADLYRQLFWFFANPTAYALLLPGLGIVCHVASSFAKKPVAGQLRVAYALVAIGFLSFMSWAEHLYTARLGSDVHGFFSLTTAIVAVPLVIVIGSLLTTLFRRSLRLRSPLLFALAFLFVLTAGGVSGIILAVLPLLQGTAAVAAHLHLVLAASAVFAIFAGWYFWFPKFTGYLFNETLARAHFWLMLFGVSLAFFPMYFLGVSGMARRAADYPAAYSGWNGMASIGAFLCALGILAFLAVLIEAFARKRKAGDNPWGEGASTLEWTLASPPPFPSFNELPKIT